MHTASRKKSKSDSLGVNWTCASLLIVASIGPIPDIAWGRFQRSLPKIGKFISRRMDILTIGVDRLV
jgi:hypothetical protein